jgi:hypothetical protein
LIGLVNPEKGLKMETTVETVTEQNKDALARLAISMYIGEKCLFCGREYKTFAELKDTVWVGQSENRRLACASCWQKNGQTG